MSLSHELRILELGTQSELLERLQLLTDFGSNLITVSGKKGSGKSWLAQRYLEAWSQDKNQSLLMCHPSQDDEKRRTIILNQISFNPLFIFNQQDLLVDSLTNLLNGEPCNIVIVVDDAHLLSDTLLSELWMVILEAHSNPAWTINVILFSEQNHLDTILNRLSYGQELKPIDIEIEQLSKQESEEFLEKLVVRYSSGEESKAKIRQAFRKTAPLPGELMALGVPKMEKRIIIRSIIGSPINIIGIVILSLLLIAGGYWWLFNNPLPDDVSALREAVHQQQMAIPASVEPVSSSVSTVTPVGTVTPEALDKIEDSLEAQSEAIVKLAATMQVNTATNSPTNPEMEQSVANGAETVTATTLPVTNSNSDEVAPTELVSAPSSLEQSNTNSNGQVTTVLDPTPTKQKSVETELVADNNTQTVNGSQTVDAPKVTTPSNVINRTAMDAKALLAIPANRYTLQIAAMNMSITKEGELESFIEQYKSQGTLRVYTTMRNGVQWNIVTLNDYASLQATRDAISGLSTALKKVGPWAKSMKVVHAEIGNNQ